MSRFIQVGRSATSPHANAQRRELVLAMYLGQNGYVQNADFVIQPIPELEKGAIVGPRAIVMHRTASSGVAGPLQSYQRTGIGTQFTIDRDGTIYQTASLFKGTSHIGKIRSRCEIDRTCGSDELRKIKGMGITAKYNHEKSKPYPQRYPLNEDSVGIEVVARNNGGDDQWEEATTGQKQSIRVLIGFLKNEYHLSDDDVYAHDEISYKTLGEGAGMYDGGAIGGLRQPPPFHDFSQE